MIRVKEYIAAALLDACEDDPERPFPPHGSMPDVFRRRLLTIFAARIMRQITKQFDQITKQLDR
jgi:hypothetical protein